MLVGTAFVSLSSIQRISRRKEEAVDKAELFIFLRDHLRIQVEAKEPADGSCDRLVKINLILTNPETKEPEVISETRFYD